MLPLTFLRNRIQGRIEADPVAHVPATRILILLLLLVFSLPLVGRPTLAQEAEWEYKVVILQGIMAGGRFEREASGVFVDTKKTSSLNVLASDGWEVIAVVGAGSVDHTVYLRRRKPLRQ